MQKVPGLSPGNSNSVKTYLTTSPCRTLACESLHMCSVYIWRCEHAKVLCGSFFFMRYIYIFVQSFIQHLKDWREKNWGLLTVQNTVLSLDLPVGNTGSRGRQWLGSVLVYSPYPEMDWKQKLTAARRSCQQKQATQTEKKAGRLSKPSNEN